MRYSGAWCVSACTAHCMHNHLCCNDLLQCSSPYSHICKSGLGPGRCICAAGKPTHAETLNAPGEACQLLNTPSGSACHTECQSGSPASSPHFAETTATRECPAQACYADQANRHEDFKTQCLGHKKKFTVSGAFQPMIAKPVPGTMQL